ncbi:glycosyltransferase [Wenyingzhuangia sp. IMCC45467]
MKTIVVSVTNDLVIDQRVHKVCTTLQEMGFGIHLVGRKLKNSLPIKRNYKTTRIKLLFNKGPLFYAEYNFRLFWFLLFTKKDVLLSNDLDTLLPNFLVSKICNKPIVYDSHELFTEVPELIHRPKVQRIWLAIEQFIFPKLKDVFTVCSSIATYYQETYDVPLKIVRNVPNSTKTIKADNNKIKNFISAKQAVIYQGAVNVGRGIELMIDVVANMDNTVLCVFGDGDVFKEVSEKVNKQGLQNKILLYGRMPPLELKRITPLFDVGLSWEDNLGMNYKYALPNKVFDYIHAEIPCLVSDLPEMKKITLGYQVGEVLSSRSIDQLKEQLQVLIDNKNTYKTSLLIAKKELNWEKESEIIKEVYSKFL